MPSKPKQWLCMLLVDQGHREAEGKGQKKKKQQLHYQKQSEIQNRFKSVCFKFWG